MKNNNIILGTLLFSAIAMASCSKDEQPDYNGLVNMEFKANSQNSRTALNGNAVNWNTTDKIAVFAAGTETGFEFTNKEESTEATSATFTGQAVKADTYYAIYPYNAESKLSGTTVSTTLASAQTAVEGTFAYNLNISAATAYTK